MIKQVKKKQEEVNNVLLPFFFVYKWISVCEKKKKKEITIKWLLIFVFFIFYFLSKKKTWLEINKYFLIFVFMKISNKFKNCLYDNWFDFVV